MVSWSNNIFLFRFEEAEDLELTLKEGPWSIMNSLLVLQPLVVGVAISEMDFNICPFWVQAHGLPVQ